MTSGRADEVFHYRLFTVEQADGLVPHLAHTFETLSEDRLALHRLAARLAPFDIDLTQPPEAIARHPELRGTLEHLGRLQRRMKHALAQLVELGVEIKDIEGVVDLRSRYQGREVYLCWRMGEPRVTHWHELDHGLAGRQAIVDRDAFEGTLLN